MPNVGKCKFYYYSSLKISDSFASLVDVHPHNLCLKTTICTFVAMINTFSSYVLFIFYIINVYLLLIIFYEQLLLSLQRG